jgi:hypothetical protein
MNVITLCPKCNAYCLAAPFRAVAPPKMKPRKARKP